MRYRRADVTGGTYFFMVNLAERSRTLLVDHVDTPRGVVRMVKTEHPFHIDAMVILPDHLHAVWTLPWAIAIIRRGGCWSRLAVRDRYQRGNGVIKAE